MDNLTLEHLAPYLPFDLKVKTEDGIFRVCGWGEEIGIFLDTIMYGADAIPSYKPILRPLSDLNKELCHNGESIIPHDYIGLIQCKHYNTNHIQNPNGYTFPAINLSYKQVNRLLEMHFDVFGLIDAGLAIDINAIKK